MSRAAMGFVPTEKNDRLLVMYRGTRRAWRLLEISEHGPSCPFFVFSRGSHHLMRMDRFACESVSHCRPEAPRFQDHPTLFLAAAKAEDRHRGGRVKPMGEIPVPLID